MAASQPIPATAQESRADQFIDLGGQAVHVFNFATPLPVAYAYFLDVPAVFRLLPDMLEIKPYSSDCYRLVIGANDGYGHTMAAIFDMQVVCEHEQALRIGPASNPPPINLSGMVFRGDLWADALFTPCAQYTKVDYAVEIALSIPVPPMLRVMPQGFLQALGEKGMAFKMSQMINGFTNSIKSDFQRWSQTS